MQWKSSTTAAVWLLRLVTTLVFASLGASVAYWTLHWPDAPEAPVPTATEQTDCAHCANPATLARLLGQALPAGPGSAAAAAPATVLQLLGVIAGPQGLGVALIAAPGQPAHHFSVGSVVANGLLLQSLGPRSAVLAPSMQAPASLTLEMPARASN